MVRIYTTIIRLEEPVSALFNCEFCDREFTREGMITVDQGIETWYREINNADISSAVESAKAKILNVHKLIETNLNGGVFPKNWSEKETRVHFDGGSKCPNCNFQQQIAVKEPWKTKRKISLAIALIMPVAIYATIVYAAIVSYIENESLISLVIAIALVALLPVGYILLNRVLSSNKGFMKTHALTKKSLPIPRRPILSYDTVKVVK